jgi:hypothetical protein
MYPHLLDLVVELAPRASLIALRTACRRMREKVDARLAYHVVVRPREDPTRANVAPVTVESPEGRLPLFYRWDEAEDTNLCDWADHPHRSWWLESQDPDVALSQRAYGARQCLQHTRVVDFAGDVPGSRITELVSAVGEDAVLRAIRGSDGISILDPNTEYDDDVPEALQGPFSKFVAFANIWEMINMPEFDRLAVGAPKVVFNLLVEATPHPVPAFEQHDLGPVLCQNTSELVIVFRSSPNPGPFTRLQRVQHLDWRTNMESGFVDGRLEDFWESLFTAGVRVTVVNFAALEEAWGLNEAAQLRERKAKTQADVRSLSLEEYQEEVGADFELETEEGTWCLWKAEPPTAHERRKVDWVLAHPDSDSDDFDEVEETDDEGSEVGSGQEGD